MLPAVQETTDQFRRDLSVAFGNRFECLVITGSHARGDAHANSDIDLWLFLDTVSLPDLDTVGQLVQNLASQPEVNVQCTSFTEVAAGAFHEGFSPLQLHFDGQVLHGTLRLQPPSRTQALREAAAIASFVTMSCRHYIVGRTPADSLLKGKLRNWVLKPLMWALRYEVFARTGHYPKELHQLVQTADSPSARELVQVFRQLLSEEFQGDSLQVVQKAEGVARHLMHAGIFSPNACPTNRPTEQ
jgi:predicted nucleotidyltransferase